MDKLDLAGIISIFVIWWVFFENILGCFFFAYCIFNGGINIQYQNLWWAAPITIIAYFIFAIWVDRFRCIPYDSI
jgi:hypothetical protein